MKETDAKKILNSMREHLIEIDEDINECYAYFSEIVKLFKATSSSISTLDSPIMTLRNRILKIENLIEELIEEDDAPEERTENENEQTGHESIFQEVKKSADAVDFDDFCLNTTTEGK